jgi:hypothetical protein
MYHSNPETPFKQAEANQLDYLLDQVRCKPGRRKIFGCHCACRTRAKRAQIPGTDYGLQYSGIAAVNGNAVGAG